LLRLERRIGNIHLLAYIRDPLIQPLVLSLGIGGDERGDLGQQLLTLVCRSLLFINNDLIQSTLRSLVSLKYGSICFEHLLMQSLVLGLLLIQALDEFIERVLELPPKGSVR